MSETRSTIGNTYRVGYDPGVSCEYAALTLLRRMDDGTYLLTAELSGQNAREVWAGLVVLQNQAAEARTALAAEQERVRVLEVLIRDCLQTFYVGEGKVVCSNALKPHIDAFVRALAHTGTPEVPPETPEETALFDEVLGTPSPEPEALREARELLGEVYAEAKTRGGVKNAARLNTIAEHVDAWLTRYGGTAEGTDDRTHPMECARAALQSDESGDCFACDEEGGTNRDCYVCTAIMHLTREPSGTAGGGAGDELSPEELESARGAIREGLRDALAPYDVGQSGDTRTMQECKGCDKAIGLDWAMEHDGLCSVCEASLQP